MSTFSLFLQIHVRNKTGKRSRHVMQDEGLRVLCKCIARGKVKNLEKKDKISIFNSLFRLGDMDEIVEDYVIGKIKKECSDVTSKRGWNRGCFHVFKMANSRV